MPPHPPRRRCRRPLPRRSPLALALACALLAPSAAWAGAGGSVQLIGRSVQGRPITVIERGAPGGRAVLVVGVIDGNEPAGIAIAHELERLTPPAGVDLWIVPVLNPDGLAAGTLGNAHGVDINRNFPYGWRSLGGSGTFDSGPHALSEPESRAAVRLIRRIHPRLSIWFHQHLTVVDDSQGDRALERRFAALVGLPAVALTDYPGSVASWENHTLPGATAFVVELPAGTLSAAAARRYAHAVLVVARG
jgi:protein MpaA